MADPQEELKSYSNRKSYYNEADAVPRGTLDGPSHQATEHYWRKGLDSLKDAFKNEPITNEQDTQRMQTNRISDSVPRRKED